MPDRNTEAIPTVERPVALIVEASFDSDTFTIDTTTIDGQRVVVMYMRDGVRYLTPAETLALSRALLSRLAYVGFPDEWSLSGDSVADRLRSVEARVERDHGMQEGDGDLAELLVPSTHVVRIAALEPGVGNVEGFPQVVSDLAHAAEPSQAVAE